MSLAEDTREHEANNFILANDHFCNFVFQFFVGQCQCICRFYVVGKLSHIFSSFLTIIYSTTPHPLYAGSTLMKTSLRALRYHLSSALSFFSASAAAWM